MNRTSQLFNHLSAISESIPALGWVTVVSFDTPVTFGKAVFLVFLQ